MLKNTADPWHFARPELARKYLRTFEIGLISAQALFAPRRMGKSEFLERDLIPEAQAAAFSPHTSTCGMHARVLALA